MGRLSCKGEQRGYRARSRLTSQPGETHFHGLAFPADAAALWRFPARGSAARRQRTRAASSASGRARRQRRPRTAGPRDLTRQVPAVEQAKFEDRGAGLARLSEGWFVLNVAGAEWLTSETSGPKQPSGAECSFETRHASFPQLGVRLHVLEPGESNGLYHRESEQEDFLVLAGECRLLVEGEERLLRAWDFVHCPAGTEHIFVGASDGPCVIFMVGGRSGDWKVVYPVSELAARYGASAEKETTDPDEAYGAYEPSRIGRPSYWDRLPWA